MVGKSKAAMRELVFRSKFCAHWGKVRCEGLCSIAVGHGLVEEQGNGKECIVQS